MATSVTGINRQILIYKTLPYVHHTWQNLRGVGGFRESKHVWYPLI